MSDNAQTQQTPIETAPAFDAFRNEDINAALQQAYKDLNPESVKEIQPVKQEEPEAPAKAETEPTTESEPDASRAEERDANAEAKDELNFEGPELDEELAKLSPALQKRWQQQVKGLKKRERDYSEKATAFKTNEERFNNLTTVEANLANPATAVATFKQLGELLKQSHGYTDAQLYGDTPQSIKKSDDGGDWESQGFEYESDYQVYQRAKAEAKAEALAEMEAKLTPYLQKIEEIKQVESKQAAQAQEQAYLDRVTPRTIKQISSEESGWKITPAMVAEAITAYPQHRDDPARAVCAHFSDERAQHIAEVAADRTPQPTTMLPSNDARGYKLKNPLDYTAKDAYEDIQQRG